MSIVTLIVLVCCKNMARKVPTNYILLFAFTFFEAIGISSVCAVSDPITVLLALVMTVALSSILTAYACVTKTDFTTKMGVMLVILVVAIFAAILIPIFYHNRLA